MPGYTCPDFIYKYCCGKDQHILCFTWPICDHA
jgi:hypothetical protein